MDKKWRTRKSNDWSGQMSQELRIFVALAGYWSPGLVFSR